MISCNAASDFGRRYAAMARILAETCTDKQRRDELLEIARVCYRVPARPAETFREALQTVWFAFLMAQIESNGHTMSLGRFDQYLYHFYEKDMTEGRLSREEERDIFNYNQFLVNVLFVIIYMVNDCIVFGIGDSCHDPMLVDGWIS